MVQVLRIVTAAVSVDDASKPVFRRRASGQAADPIKLADVELLHSTKFERAARQQLHTRHEPLLGYRHVSRISGCTQPEIASPRAMAAGADCRPSSTMRRFSIGS